MDIDCNGENVKNDMKHYCDFFWFMPQGQCALKALWFKV
jgi:hypothetical protein